MQNLKKTGRITGALYLVVIICAGFSQGVVRESVYVAGDAAMTAQNILNAETLFRWGLITDLIAFCTDVAISVLLYMMLKDVNKTVAFIMAAFRLIAHPAVATLNLLNHYAALKVLEGPGFAARFSNDQLVELSQFFMEAHHMGYILAGVLFAAHCLLLGYLLMRSAVFPKILGVLMIVASLGYFTESFGFILYPDYKIILGWIVGLSAVLGEVTFTIWLLVKGTRTSQL